MLLCFMIVWFTASVLPVYVSALVTNYSCPTWLYYSNVTQQCECGYQTASIHCNKLTMKAHMKSGYCITYSGQDGVYYGGICPIRYKVNNTDRLYSELPSDPELLEEAVCGTYNRKGFQCAQCIDGYGPGVYSFDRTCAECSKLSMMSRIVFYLLADYVPITLFFIAVVVLRINITSGPILGYMMFSQGLSVSAEYDANIYNYIHSHSSTFVRALLATVMSIFESWNLNLLKPLIPAFCISERLSGVHILLLDSFKSIYPLILVIVSLFLIERHANNNKIIHFLWKPFSAILKKMNLRISASDALIRAFATLILLSSTTNMFAVYAMTQNVKMCRNTDHSLYRTVMYFDATVDYTSPKHIVFLAIAIVQCLFLVVLPSLLLFFYPTRVYRWFTQFISARKQQAIRTFVEALHSSFKDGLNGTRDYRALAGVLIFGFPLLGLWCWLVKIVIFTEYDIDISVFFTFSFLSLLLSYMRPLKSIVANMSLSFYSFLFGVCGLAHYLWMLNTSTSTEALELSFLFIALSAQFPVLVWAGYRCVCYFKPKIAHCLDLSLISRMK